MKNLIGYFVISFSLVLNISPSLGGPETHAMEEARKSSGEKGGDYFRSMDTSGDGLITKEEFDAAHDKHFHEMDANGDNKLSHEEMRDGHRQNLDKVKDKRFNEADADNDGTLTRDEAKKMPRVFRRFERMDSNKDGKLTREEVDAGMKKKQPDRK